MKQRARARKGPAAKKRAGVRTHAVRLGKPLALPGNLGKVLALIKAHRGIRPSEINRRLGLTQSDGLRGTLIRRGLIRKKKDGSAVRYYAV
jgi:uncharacterized membrane protein